jgi:hypothetical protein
MGEHHRGRIGEEHFELLGQPGELLAVVEVKPLRGLFLALRVGETTTIIFSRSREMPESDLLHEFADSGRPADMVQRVFSDQAESPFAEFVPNVKQTGIFLDRFFHKLTYAHLAAKYETSPDTARKIYRNGVKRVLELLQMMDEKPRGMEQYQKQIEERSGKMPKGQKWFLMSKVFGIMPSQIAEMEGMKSSSSVRQLIIRVSDQLRAGEIRLIDATPEESAEAKKRLDEHREKRRERHERAKSGRERN